MEVQPSDPRVPAYYYNFAEFVSSAKMHFITIENK